MYDNIKKNRDAVKMNIARSFKTTEVENLSKQVDYKDQTVKQQKDSKDESDQKTDSI